MDWCLIMRITSNHPLLPHVERGEPFNVVVDGEVIQAYPGETIATVLTAIGRRVLHHTENGHSPRGVYCGIGLCFGCLVSVDGVPGVRACVTTVQPGMHILTDDQSEDLS